VATAKENTFPC